LSKWKKAILILCLCLSITVSISSGTIAKYTKTLDSLDASVTAKSFYVEYKNQDLLDAIMAPGESVYRQYTITNTRDGFTTEVDMDLNIEFQSWAAEGYQPIENLQISIQKYDPAIDGENKWKPISEHSSVSGTGIICEKIEKAFLANISNEVKIRVVIYWPADPTVQADDLIRFRNNLKLVVNGTQHIS